MTDILINDSASAIPITLLTKDTLPGWLDGQPGRVKAWVEAQGFKANAHQTLGVPGEGGALERILLGVDAQAGDASPWPFAGLPTALPAGDYRLDGDLTSVRATAALIGWGLGAYRFDRYKKPSDDKPLPRLAIPSDADDAYARAAIDAACLVRDLVNTPANDMGPAELAAAARTLADRFGASCYEVAGKDLLTPLPNRHLLLRFRSSEEAAAFGQYIELLDRIAELTRSQFRPHQMSQGGAPITFEGGQSGGVSE